MKSILTTLIAMTIGFCHGQNLICIQSPGNLKPIFTTSLDSAISKAKSGDYIYLPGGFYYENPQIFNEYKIGKKLHIYGAGYHPDSSKATGTSEFLYNFIFESGSAGSSLSGIRKYGGGSVIVKDSNIIVSRNYLGSTFNLFIGAKNLSITENVFGLEVASQPDPIPNGSPTPLNNSLISNNIFLSHFQTGNYTGGFNEAMINNNIFINLNTRPNGPFVNCQFHNNIITNPTVDTPYIIIGSSINNNLFVCDSPEFKSKIYTWGGNTGSDNLFGEPISNIFQKYNGAFPDPFIINYNWMKQNDFHLKSSSNGKNKGTDGKDVGIYGGQYPFRDGGIPDNPHFVSAKVATVVNPKYQLPINLIVTAQGTNNKITGYRYFFDDKHDSITHISLAMPQQYAVINDNIAINPSTLDTGFHRIYIQFKDTNGLWSSIVSKAFTFLGQSKLTSIVSNKGGNTGNVTVNIYGSGFYEGTKVKLAKGNDTIYAADSLTGVINNNWIIVTFDLSGKTIGSYDVVLEIPDADSALNIKSGFHIVEGISANPYTQLLGPDLIRQGAWQNYSVLIGNSGNVDAKAVPIWIAVPIELDLRFIDKFIEEIENDTANYDSIQPYFIIDTLFEEAGQFKVYQLISPTIGPNNSTILSFQLKSNLSNVLKIYAWNSSPYYNSPMPQDKFNCLMDIFWEAFGQVAPNRISCIANLTDVFISRRINNLLYYGNLGLDGNTSGQKFGNFLFTAFNAAIGCIPSSKVEEIAREGLKRVQKSVSWLGRSQTAIGCAEGFLPDEVINPKTIRTVGSFDPNDKIGPSGFNGSPSFNPTKPFSYQIRFENVDSATAPAQQVIIIDTLDKNVFDLATFQLGMVSIGDTVVSFSQGLSADSIYIDLSDKGINATVKVKGSLDITTGIATWVFDGLDPETLEPITDALGGFLPPNKNAPEGEGSVFYTIKLKDHLPSNTVISNKAYIYFDFNPPIITPEWKNVLDIVPPESKVNPLPQFSSDSIFTVSWQGSDVGSGLLSYSIYYKINNGDYRLWIANTFKTSVTFSGKPDSTYSFYSIARDTALNVEAAPSVEDAKTTVRVTTGISKVSNEGIYTKVYPNPAKESFTLQIYHDEQTQYKILITDITGKKVAIHLVTGNNLPEFEISSKDLTNGLYFIVISDSENRIYGNQKILIAK